MRTTQPQPPRLGDYTSRPFEVFVAAFTVLPFLALAYFYSELPARVPLFLNLGGDVAVWGEKSLLSVFRVPLMAADTQLFCLLVKYGAVKSEAFDAGDAGGAARDEIRRRHLRLNAGLWDWFRCLVAFKMSAASLDTVFLSVARFNPLSRPAYLITAAAALLSVAGGLFYAYRLLGLRREAGGRLAGLQARRPVDARRVRGGVIYFNPDDPALFAGRYVLNFGNWRAWAFVACLAAYPLLVFLPG